MTKPKIRTIQDVAELSSEFFSGTVGDIYVAVAGLIEEYGKDAYVNTDAYDDYLEVSVQWDRDETEKERDKRLVEAKKWKNYKAKQKESKLVNERKEYLRLKKKFEDKDA